MASNWTRRQAKRVVLHYFVLKSRLTFSIDQIAPETAVKTETKRAKQSSVELTDLPKVLDIILHPHCNLYSTAHGKQMDNCNSAMNALAAKGIVTTVEFLKKKVNIWLDQYEKELSEEETGNEESVFTDCKEKMEKLSKLRNYKRTEKSVKVEKEQKKKVKREESETLRGMLTNQIAEHGEKKLAKETADEGDKGRVEQKERKKNLLVSCTRRYSARRHGRF
jgi:hypothetical protein